LFLKGPYSNVRPFFCSKSKPPPSTDGGGFLFYGVFKPGILIVNTLRDKYRVRDRSKLPCSADSPARRARH